MTEKERYEKLAEVVEHILGAIESLEFKRDTEVSWGYNSEVDPMRYSDIKIRSAKALMGEILESFGDEQ